MTTDRPHPQSNGRRWLNSTVLGIGLASLCSDVGHEMATAAMPAFLASIGASSAVLGLIEGTADGLSSFAKLLSGLHSDRLRHRKPLAVVGYFVTASGMAAFALATQWWHVLFARVFGWIGRGVRTPVRNVLLTEATTPETYGRAFGLERAMDSAGAVIGPALSLLLVAWLGLRWTFALTLIPGVIAALLIALLVRERVHEPQPRIRLWTSVTSLPKEFRRYLVGVGIAGLGDFSNTLLILWATQAWTVRFGVMRAATLAMGFYVGYNVIYTLSCYISGMLADHFPRHRVLAIGYSLAVVPAVALLWPGDSFAKFGVIFGFSGIYMGVWETLENTTAAMLLPAAARGVGFGVLATVNGLGDFVSSVAVGALWLGSPGWAMSFVIATSLIGAVVIANPPLSRALVQPQDRT
ncbi:MAG: MFS transporter [Lacunisphaera sp.]